MLEQKRLQKVEYPRLIEIRSDHGIQDESVFAGGKQACKTKNGGRTHTCTCSHFARGPLSETARRRWRRSAGGVSPFSLQSSQDWGRGESEKKRQKERKWASPPLLRCAHPHPVAAFVKTIGPVGFHSKARVTGAHLRVSRRNPTLAGERGVCDFDRSVRNRA